MRLLRQFASSLALFALLLQVTMIARAAVVTNVTVAGITISSWRYGGTVAKLRVYASDTFDQTGTLVIGSKRGSGQWYQEVSCTVAGTVLSIPSFNLQVTTNSSNATASYTFVFVDFNNRERDIYLGDIQVPDTFGANVTWSQLYAYNTQRTPRHADWEVYNKDQVNALLASAAGSSADSSTTTKGIGKLATAPASSTNPIFVGDNDPRLVPTDSSTTAKGVVKLSAAPLSASNPIAVGDLDPRLTSFVVAETFAGSDIGAKINAADVFLGATEGEIRVGAGGNIATQVVISAKHHLHIVAGNYSATTNGAVIRLKDNSSLECDGWGPILQESTGSTAVSSPFTVVAPYNGASADAVNGTVAQNIVVHGCHIKGARSDFSSGPQGIAMANCHNCQVTGNWMDATHTIGIQAGGGSGSGNYADGVLIAHNLLTGGVSQQLAVVNSQNVIVSDNQVLATGQIGGPGVSAIDLEPNVGDRLFNIRVHNNVVNAVDSVTGITNGIVVQNGNAASPFGAIEIANNTVIGALHSTPASNKISFAGILIRTAQDVKVVNNTVTRVAWGILLDTGTNSTLVQSNRLIDCGSGGSTFPITVLDSNANFVAYNQLFASFGDALNFSNAIAKAIVESGTSTFNYFWENNGIVTSTSANTNGSEWGFKGRTVPSAATIIASGNIFHVSGTTGITSISANTPFGGPVIPGTVSTLIFDGVLTVTNGSNLKLNGNYTTAINSSLTVVYDGTNWVETSRSITSGSGGSFATPALDNLASVAINTALLPAADVTTNIGSGAKRFLGANFTKLPLLTTNGPLYLSAGDGTMNSENQLATSRGGTGVSDFTFSGSTHKAGSTSGTLTNGNCVQIDASFNLVDAGGPCSIGGGGGTVTIGAANRLTYYPAAATSVSPTGAYFTVDNTNSVINLLGGMRINRTATATNYTVLKSDRYIAVTDTTAARTITLPDLGTADAGTEITIGDESNGATVNNISIVAGGADTFITGLSGPVILDVNNAIVTLLWTGTSATAGWRIK